MKIVIVGCGRSVRRSENLDADRHEESFFTSGRRIRPSARNVKGRRHRGDGTTRRSSRRRCRTAPTYSLADRGRQPKRMAARWPRSRSHPAVIPRSTTRPGRGPRPNRVVTLCRKNLLVYTVAKSTNRDVPPASITPRNARHEHPHRPPRAACRRGRLDGRRTSCGCIAGRTPLRPIARRHKLRRNRGRFRQGAARWLPPVARLSAGRRQTVFVIVVGGGKVGTSWPASSSIGSRGTPSWSAIGPAPRRSPRRSGRSSFPHDGCEGKYLGEAGANRADIVSRTGDDEDNLVICQWPTHFDVRDDARSTTPRTRASSSTWA